MPYIKMSALKKSTENDFNIFLINDSLEKRVKRNDKDSFKIIKDDLILYSPIILGFSYRNKIWGE